MSEQTRRIAEGILDRLNVSTEDFAALNTHLHSEHAAGYKAGVLAGLERACYLLGAWPRYRLLDELLKTMAHLERTGKLPKGG